MVQKIQIVLKNSRQRNPVHPSDKEHGVTYVQDNYTLKTLAVSKLTRNLGVSPLCQIFR